LLNHAPHSVKRLKAEFAAEDFADFEKTSGAVGITLMSRSGYGDVAMARSAT
jgi:hypothetical protein